MTEKYQEILREYEAVTGNKLSNEDKRLIEENVLSLALPFRSEWPPKEEVLEVLRSNETVFEAALYVIDRDFVNVENISPLKRGVILSVGQTGRIKGLKSLARHIENPETNLEVIIGLGYIGGSESKRVLNDFLYKPEKNSNILCYAVKYLGKVGGEKEILAYLEKNRETGREMFREKSDKRYIRRQIAKTLGEMRAFNADSVLISLINDNDTDVVDEAAYSLAQLKATDSVPDLLKCLKRNDCPPKVAYALGELGDEVILDDLVLALVKNYQRINDINNEWHLRDSTPRWDLEVKNSREVVNELLKAMRKINERKSRVLLEESLNQGGHGGYSVIALSEFGYTNPRTFIECLKSSNPVMVRYAALALGRLKAKEASPYLKELLSSKMTYDSSGGTTGIISKLAGEIIEKLE